MGKSGWFPADFPLSQPIESVTTRMDTSICRHDRLFEVAGCIAPVSLVLMKLKGDVTATWMISLLITSYRNLNKNNGYIKWIQIGYIKWDITSYNCLKLLISSYRISWDMKCLPW